MPWDKDNVILARLPLVEAMHHGGPDGRRMTNVAIAAALGVDEGTVRNDLKRIREIWLKTVKADVVQNRADILAELNDITRRALAAAAFDEAAERAVLYGTDVAGKDVVIRRDDKGSAQFRGQKASALNVARQAVMDRAKVLGVVIDKTEINPSDDFLAALRGFGHGDSGS